MYNDKITLKDLSVFSSEAGLDIFRLLNHTTTHAGKEALRKHVLHPPDTFEQLTSVQQTVLFWSQHLNEWPTVISNGTLVMLEKFFESADGYGTPPGRFSLALGSLFQKVFNRGEYFFTRFSVSHIADFLKGCAEFVALKERYDLPPHLKHELEMMADDMKPHLVDELLNTDKTTPYTTLIKLAYRARREIKNNIYRLLNHYARLDAWHSMAKASVTNGWVFPKLLSVKPLHYEAEGLYHPLLKTPVSYDIAFKDGDNFMILTGANMSGKTTFMRAVGVAALLAHLGTGVPAKKMNISFLHGVVTNMHVEDNILQGESYFFAEVQRMKQTAQKLLQPQPHIVLMDELFKGTNVHDAYECTRAVVDGLLNCDNHLLILSTHLYEVAQHFADRKNIVFSYFVTKSTADGNFFFTYDLKEGISNDRIGYRILQNEGVLDLLKQQKKT